MCRFTLPLKYPCLSVGCSKYVTPTALYRGGYLQVRQCRNQGRDGSWKSPCIAGNNRDNHLVCDNMRSGLTHGSITEERGRIHSPLGSSCLVNQSCYPSLHKHLPVLLSIYPLVFPISGHEHHYLDFVSLRFLSTAYYDTSSQRLDCRSFAQNHTPSSACPFFDCQPCSLRDAPSRL